MLKSTVQMEELLLVWARWVSQRDDGGCGWRVMRYVPCGGSGIPVLPPHLCVDDLDRLCRLVPMLPEYLRETLHVRYFTRGTAETMAARLGVTPRTMYRRLGVLSDYLRRAMVGGVDVVPEMRARQAALLIPKTMAA